MAIAAAPEVKKLTGIELMAHLYRRAGFGASRDELEAALAKGYEATIEELLHPETAPPLEEKLTLFWHHLFPTGFSKLNHAKVMINQVDMFRRNALGDFRTLLV